MFAASVLRGSLSAADSTTHRLRLKTMRIAFSTAVHKEPSSTHNYSHNCKSTAQASSRHGNGQAQVGTGLNKHRQNHRRGRLSPSNPGPALRLLDKYRLAQ